MDNCELYSEVAILNAVANMCRVDDTALPSSVLIKGCLLDSQPENIDPIEFTHFDCWADLDNDGEPVGELYQWGDSGADEICRLLIESFSHILDQDLIHLSRGIEYGDFENHDAFFLAATAELIKADYFCYLSDTCFEVYTGDSVRAEHLTETLLEMVAK